MQIKDITEMAKMKAVRSYRVGSTGETVMPKIAAEIKKLLSGSFPDVEVEYYQQDPKVWILSVAHHDLDFDLQREADRNDALSIAEKHDDVISAEPDSQGIPSKRDQMLGALPWFSIKVTCK